MMYIMLLILNCLYLRSRRVILQMALGLVYFTILHVLLDSYVSKPQSSIEFIIMHLDGFFNILVLWTSDA